MMKISGCIALVTGGASGIGRGISELLLHQGAKVAVIDVNDERGKEVESTFGEKYGTGCIKFIRCDVSVERDLKEAFSQVISLWGQIDIVCNNAAVLDEDNWNKTLNINLHSVIRSKFLGIELMKNGVIINLSSTGGIHPVSFCPVYCASKFGVIGFSRSVAPTAYRKKGIRVNCVCPGGTDTDIYKSMERMELTKEQQELTSNTPKQTPEAVAQCVVDLIKDETVVGQVVKVTYEDGVEFLNYNDIVI